MQNDERIPHFEYEPPKEATRDERRGAQTLRREVDRATGEIETRDSARERYEELGLTPPEAYED